MHWTMNAALSLGTVFHEHLLHAASSKPARKFPYYFQDLDDEADGEAARRSSQQLDISERATKSEARPKAFIDNIDLKDSWPPLLLSKVVPT